MANTLKHPKLKKIRDGIAMLIFEQLEIQISRVLEKCYGFTQIELHI